MSPPDKPKQRLLGQRLKEARKLAGLSQGHVARMLNLHRPSLSEIEAGNRRVSAVELAQLSEIYDVDIAWLLGAAPATLDADDSRLQLAARELAKLKPEDLERLLRLLASMRGTLSDEKDG
jgi:transcriptional regulator with XRE-family HTH domain